MSDPVSSSDIEDVLSSIRRLVSDEPVARRKKADTDGEPFERLVLTPAFRVKEEPGTARDASALEDVAEMAAEPVSDTAHDVHVNLASEDEHTGVDMLHFREDSGESSSVATSKAHAADPAGTMAEAPDETSQGHLPEAFEATGDWTEPAPEATDEPEEQGALSMAPSIEEDVLTSGRKRKEAKRAKMLAAAQDAQPHPAEMSLAERIAELEAAIQQAPQEWEPDGSETDEDDQTRPISRDLGSAGELVERPEEAADVGASDDRAHEDRDPFDDVLNAEHALGAAEASAQSQSVPATMSHDTAELENVSVEAAPEAEASDVVANTEQENLAEETEWATTSAEDLDATHNEPVVGDAPLEDEGDMEPTFDGAAPKETSDEASIDTDVENTLALEPERSEPGDQSVDTDEIAAVEHAVESDAASEPVEAGAFEDETTPEASSDANVENALVLERIGSETGGESVDTDEIAAVEHTVEADAASEPVEADAFEDETRPGAPSDTDVENALALERIGSETDDESADTDEIAAVEHAVEADAASEPVEADAFEDETRPGAPSDTDVANALMLERIGSETDNESMDTDEITAVEHAVEVDAASEPVEADDQANGLAQDESSSEEIPEATGSMTDSPDTAEPTDATKHSEIPGEERAETEDENGASSFSGQESTDNGAAPFGEPATHQETVIEELRSLAEELTSPLTLDDAEVEAEHLTDPKEEEANAPKTEDAPTHRDAAHNTVVETRPEPFILQAVESDTAVQEPTPVTRAEAAAAWDALEADGEWVDTSSEPGLFEPTEDVSDTNPHDREMEAQAADADPHAEPIFDDIAELSASAVERDTDAASSEGAETIDEEALRIMISDIVRNELSGVLGERITRNVRRLIRREIQRALAVRDLE